MHAAVIYATRSGNTKLVATAIADSLRESGEVDLFDVGDAPADLDSFDLVVIGGPTEAHGVTPAVVEYLRRLETGTLRHRPAAAFDTRLAWPRTLSGSAAEGIAHQLKGEGAMLAAEPESFIVSRKPELKPGELDHAGRWAHRLAQTVEPRVTPAASR